MKISLLLYSLKTKKDDTLFRNHKVAKVPFSNH